MTRFYCILPILGVCGAAILMRPTKVESACCYFSAKEKDVSQPGQKAFLTWDPLEKIEWAKKLTARDMDVIDGTARYNRSAPRADIDNLKLLRGHLKEGQFVTKIRKAFTKRECDADLVFVPATLFREKDDMEYFTMLPTSPP
jgi:hypothetical protein